MLPIRRAQMVRPLIVILVALSVPWGRAAASGDPLPQPPEIEPNVRFWTRIYSEIDANGGLIHDSVHVDVVYEVVRFGDGLSARTQERQVERVKRRYREILRQLAGGKRSGLSREQARVLALWPDGVSNATLRAAARQVRFQLGQADRFREGLQRAGAWREYIQGVLLDHGVPLELVALPHVESSYNAKAYSRVGAAGLWQFTRSTGRRFLRIDHVVDERLDPFKATVAAARLLQDNYRRTQAWPLAITAYNHGVSGMLRAVRKLGTRDLATIVKRYRSRTFGFASRNFYSEFLAALEVDRHAERYFGPIELHLPVEYQIVAMDHFYPIHSLERALGVELALLREHNRPLRSAVWNGAKYVPRGYELRIPVYALTAPPTQALATIPESERFAKQHRDRFYKVRRGDTLSKIARRYGVRQSELVGLNNLRSRHRIRVGQVLRLPDAAASLQVAPLAPPADGIYRVRRGDTLSTIARRFGTTEVKLAALNSLRDRNRLSVGQRLRLFEVPATVASAPSREARAPAPPREPVAVDRPGAQPELADAPEPPAPLAPRSAVDDIPAPEPAAEAPDPLAAEPLAAEAPAAQPPSASLPPDPSNYAVSPGNQIIVQAEETLGHYAEWLEVRASRLRRLNGLRLGTPVVIGRPAKLDLSRVSPQTFERRRLEYHRMLQEEFFESFVVTGTGAHVLRTGDTLWYLARRKFKVPVWLLRQYNPDLDFASLPVGERMVVPLVERRRG